MATLLLKSVCHFLEAKLEKMAISNSISIPNFVMIEQETKLKGRGGGHYAHPHMLTLFDMGFFESSVMGGGHKGPHHNFVVVASMITKFGTGIKRDAFYTMVAKYFMTSLLLRNYDVITCILVDT